MEKCGQGFAHLSHCYEWPLPCACVCACVQQESLPTPMRISTDSSRRARHNFACARATHIKISANHTYYFSRTNICDNIILMITWHTAIFAFSFPIPTMPFFFDAFASMLDNIFKHMLRILSVYKEMGEEGAFTGFLATARDLPSGECRKDGPR